MKLAREFKEGFYAPFVGDSALKIGMKHLDSMELPNGCLFIIGEIALALKGIRDNFKGVKDAISFCFVVCDKQAVRLAILI